MGSTQALSPNDWTTTSDAGQPLVSALGQGAAGAWEPTGLARRRRSVTQLGARAQASRHEPQDRVVLARVLGGLKALPSRPAPDAALPRRQAGPPAGVHADLAVWPLFAGLGPLGALPTAPRLVRAFSRLVLGAWGLTAFSDDAELLMSELATNAVAAATGPDGRPRYDHSGSLHLLWARLLSDRSCLRLEVWDTVPLELGAPAQREAEATDESGRGLELLDALSISWGWGPVPGRAAKQVWAELPAPSRADDRAIPAPLEAELIIFRERVERSLLLPAKEKGDASPTQ
ncbi:MAG TPA: ATP-binding protein [Trebonia sp.]|nr:ATP-binding protein [Trebonia sp.]